MKPGDRIYFLIDRFTEIPGRVVEYDAETEKVVVISDDDGETFKGFEEQTRPNDDDLSETDNNIESVI